MSGWINFAEYRPEPETHVLVCGPGWKEPVIGKMILDPIFVWMKNKSVTVSFLTPENRCIANVTLWMNLPEVPA